MALLRSKPNPTSKFSSEVMLKTSKSVRIVDNQRPQHWDVTMTETYGIAKTTNSGAKTNSSIQRLKRGHGALSVDSKASPTRAQIGKEVARPLSTQGLHIPISGSGEITAIRPTPRSRDASRMTGGAGPSTTLSGLGSTALKALTSSVVRGRASNEDITSSRNLKLVNHQVASGGWVWKNARSGSSEASVDMVAESSKAVVKTDSDEVEELIEWIPSRESGRAPERILNEIGYGEDSAGPELGHCGHHPGEFREERLFRSARGLSLRDWKGGFLRGDHVSHGNLDATVSDRSRTIDNRSTSAPVRTAPTRVVTGTFTASPSPSVQRGVRENCEHFRRQMRLLKEKANDTRMREEEVESMAERLQNRFVEEIDLSGGDIWLSDNHIRVDDDELEELREVHRFGRFSTSFQTLEHAGYLERTSLESLNKTMTRLMNGDHPNSNPSSPPPETIGSRPLKEIKQEMIESVSISSSSTSSQSSLPLSHYIQKLRESRLKKSAKSGIGGRQVENMVHKYGSEDGYGVLLSTTVAGLDPSERQDNMKLRASSLGSSPAMLLTTSSASSSPKANHPLPPLPHIGNRVNSQLYPSLVCPPQTLNNRKSDSDLSSIAMLQTHPDGQHLTAISDSGAIIATTQLQAGGKLDQQAICYPPDELRARVLSRSIYESVRPDANDGKIAHLQRALGELKGSMEGLKIRVEVESEGWRDRVDRLENELEMVKETDDEISAAKQSFKNELKLKFSEFMSDTEKLIQKETEQVQVMIEERIEDQVKGQLLVGCWTGMREEMCLLWNEVKSLIKSREDIAGHVEHLTSVTEEARELSSREQDMLKSENGFLRKQLQSLQSDSRQVEIGALQTRLGKVQDETEESEREREMTLVAGARERLVMMERVENLSQLFLGGLEEMRQDVIQVKSGCNERVEDLECQWNDFKRDQGILCEAGRTFLPRQELLDELDQFRCEIVDMVEIERGLLKDTLEKESASIWRKVMDAYSKNKSDMLSMLKLEIQKQLHSAREKVLNMTDTLEHDMDTLRTELKHTQDGAEDLTQIIISVNRQKEVAAQAAAEATSSATKTREILNDMLVSIESEVANVRLESMHLQEKLTIEKDIAVAAVSETRTVSQEVLKEKEAALAAFQEVRQKSQELQDYLEKESPKLVTAMVVVQKERETASQAAAEATSSAMKAGGVLAKVSGSFNLEMAKARHINMQLKEGLEHERGLATHLNQEVQDRVSEELGVAIATWKHAMDEEVARVKNISEGLEKDNQWQKPGFPLIDLEEYTSKTEDKLSSLMTTVELLQCSTNNYDEEKKRLKQDWKVKMTQLNQVVETFEERVDELSSEQTELRKRLKKSEGIHAELTLSVEEVRSNTSTLEKTVNLFLPQYDDAVQVVNDLSSKVERMKKRIEGIAYDDDLVQEISRVAEAKVESLKGSAVSPVGLENLGRDLRELQERVESNDHSHCQAISEVETRVSVLESTICDIQNGERLEKVGIEALSGSVDALQRKMDTLEQNGALSADQTALENRIDHVSSATFTNLQLLDKKLERVSTGVQSALEGAASADNKCGALGAELVKVFRMLTFTTIPKNARGIGDDNWPGLPDDGRGRRGRSHSPSSRSASQKLESRSQSPPSRLNQNLAWNSSRDLGQSPPRRAHVPPKRLKAGTTEKRRGGEGSSELRGKLETRVRDRAKGDPEGDPSRGRSPSKNDNWLKSYPREARLFRLGKKIPGQELTVVEDRKHEPGPHLALERRPKNLQKTNIRLEGGRIHVNVSRRSAAANAIQSEKRSAEIAVQS